MTLYTKLDYGDGPSWEGYEPSFGESVGFAWADAWASNPTPSLLRMGDIMGASRGLNKYDVAALMDAAEGGASGADLVSMLPEPPRSLSLKEQEARIKDAGLAGFLEAREGYTPEVLDILIPLKKAELSRRLVASRAPAWHKPASFAASLGASALDPINVASAFVPVVGEARVLSLLSKAKGAWGRAAVRAKVGVAEGAVGAALVEPLVYAGQKAVQADYDMTDSLLNVGFGAVMGAGLQPAAGGVGDFLRRRRGLIQPWAVAEKTEESEALRLDMASRMERAFLEANPEADAGEARRNSLASAALYDARARAWAYDTGKNAEDYYTRYRVEFKVGTEEERAGADALEQATYRSKAASIREFLSEVDAQGNQSVYVFGNIFRNDAGIENAAIELRGSTVQHIRKNHPDFEQWDRIEHAVKNGEGYEIPPDRATKLPGRAFTIEEGQKWHVVLGYIQNTKRGQRFIVGTSFLDTPGRAQAWLKQKQATPLYQSAGTYPAWSSPRKAGRLSELNRGGLSDTTINSLGSEGNPRARVDFDADGRAVISFFRSSDFSSAPHELYHIFRRELAETALAPDASPDARERWAKIEEFVGAEPGRAWTGEMEEKFARAGERFLLEGKAPSPELRGVFERLKQWFLEIYADADAAGLEISPAMREVFNGMFSVSSEKAEASFRYAVGDLATREAEREFDSAGNIEADVSGPISQKGDVEIMGELQQAAEIGLDETLNVVAQSEPKAAEKAIDDFMPDLAAADADITRVRTIQEVIRQAAACEVGR